MSRFLEKIKSFFKRAREEDEPTSERPRTKRARYVSTPATIKFHPKQVHQKRVARMHYFLNELLDTTEDRNYEFKAGGMLLQKSSLRMMIQKYGSAFLNSEGGVLIGGVSDNGQVNGIWCSTKQEVELENTVKNEFRSFRPSVDEDFYTVKFLPVMRNGTSLIYGLKVVEIHIYKGDDNDLYETGNHEVFIRRDGGAQGPLRPLAIKDVVEQKYQKVLKVRKEKEHSSQAAEKKSRTRESEKSKRSSGSGSGGQRSRKPIVVDLTNDSPIQNSQESTAPSCKDRPSPKHATERTTEQFLIESRPPHHDIQSSTEDHTQQNMKAPMDEPLPLWHTSKNDIERTAQSNCPEEPPPLQNTGISMEEASVKYKVQQTMPEMGDGSTIEKQLPYHNEQDTLTDRPWVSHNYAQNRRTTTDHFAIEREPVQQQLDYSRENRPTCVPPEIETVNSRFKIRRPAFTFSRSFFSDVRKVFNR